MPPRRQSRTTQRQFATLLNLMESHPKLMSGRLDSNFTVQDRKRLWQMVADSLNAEGSSKNPEKWRKTWNDWKANVRSKAMNIMKQFQNGDIVELNPGDGLSPLEERLLNMIGWPNAQSGENSNDEQNASDSTPQRTSEEQDDNTMFITIVKAPEANNKSSDEQTRSTSELKIAAQAGEASPEPASQRSNSSSEAEDEPLNLVEARFINEERPSAGCKRKRHQEKTVRELIASNLSSFEEKKIQMLQRIAEATERKAAAEERIAAAEERKAAAEERKATALQDIAAALIRRPIS